jgi:hypothetical protein
MSSTETPPRFSNLNKESETNQTQSQNQKPTRVSGLGLSRRNSLLENNALAKWVNDILMKKMDEYAYVRSMMALIIITYFLGNNLGIYISLYIFFTCYLFALRIIRAWVKRWLLYLIEFCYYGCFSVVIYVAVFPQSRIVWSTVYICSTGVLTWAAYIFANQARMDSSDHLISSFIHSFPMITVWAIRWKSILYNSSFAPKDKFQYNLLDFSDLTFENDEHFYYLFTFPFIFWGIWAVYYYFSTNHLWSVYIKNPKYCSGLGDFKSSTLKTLPKLYGDHDYKLTEKYLFTHFTLFSLATPVAILCYYNFYFNTFFLISTLVFLSWNAGRASKRSMERLLKKIDNGMNVDKSEKKEE